MICAAWLTAVALACSQRAEDRSGTACIHRSLLPTTTTTPSDSARVILHVLYSSCEACSRGSTCTASCRLSAHSRQHTQGLSRSPSSSSEQDYEEMVDMLQRMKTVAEDDSFHSALESATADGLEDEDAGKRLQSCKLHAAKQEPR